MNLNVKDINHSYWRDIISNQIWLWKRKYKISDNDYKIYLNWNEEKDFIWLGFDVYKNDSIYVLYNNLKKYQVEVLERDRMKNMQKASQFDVIFMVSVETEEWRLKNENLSKVININKPTFVRIFFVLLILIAMLVVLAVI